MLAASTFEPEGLPGDLFAGSPYRAIERLVSGGMGELFVVEHESLQRTFVAKVLHRGLADDAILVDRFRIEAQALGRLNHPNIVSVTGFGTASDGRPYLILEHLEGRALSEEIDSRGVVPIREALAYADQLLAALGAAHEMGIVHRDIKPSNLFLCAQASGLRTLKVLDFGVARVVPDAPAVAPHQLSVQTDTGVVVGTPRFVSPEGAIGRRVDHRADIYAAGLVLYVMLTGRGPFDHLAGGPALLSAHAVSEPKPPSHYAPGTLSEDIDRAVLRALAKSPAHRFQTADEFRAALVEIGNRLARPEEWIATAAFDLSALAASSMNSTEDHGDSLESRDLAVANSGLSNAATAPHAPFGLSVPRATPASPPSPSGLTSSLLPRAIAAEPSSSAVTISRSRHVLIGVFVIGLLLAGAVAVGLVGLLRGFL